MKDKLKVVITGGCGFVGTNLALHYSEKGYEVLCIDDLSRPSSEYNRKILQDQRNIIIVENSVQDFFSTKTYGEDRRESTTSPLLNGTDIILNCAAQSGSMKGYDTPLNDIENNFNTVVSLCHYAATTKTPLIHWSTNKVYGNKFNRLTASKDKEGYSLSKVNQKSYTNSFTRFYPELRRGIYGCTKYLAEVLLMEYHQQYKFPLIINRFSCLAGPYQYAMADQGWLSQFITKAILREPVTLYGFNGDQVRDILHIDDLKTIIDNQIKELLCDKSSKDTIRNIGGGKSNAVTLNEVIKLCSKLIAPVDVSILPESRPLDQNWFVADNESLPIGWKPTKNVEETIKEISSWSYKKLNKIKELRNNYSNDFH